MQVSSGLKKPKNTISKTSTINPRFAAGGESWTPASKTESKKSDASMAPATEIKMKSDPLNLNNLYPGNKYLLKTSADTYDEMARMDEENSQLALEASLLQECYMHLNYKMK